LPRKVVVSITYTQSRGVHALRSRNVNALLPGNGIYLYEASGRFRQHQLITNVNARVSPKLTLTGFYAWNRARSDTDGAGTFPANPYDLSTEFGRAGFDIRHRVVANGSILMPAGLRLSPFVVVSSGRPFNITLGRDVNGDTLFTDRPALATDLSRSSVVRTPFGTFDTAPQPGQKLVPRNYGDGPGLVSMDLRLSKAVALGEKAASGDAEKQLTFTVSARNLLNHANLALPVGNLNSQFFGSSTALAGGGTGSNRRLDLQVKFSF